MIDEKNQTTSRRSLYAYRYIARIILQAKTPLAIGSGESNIQTDAPVIRDVNGLPFIPGTGLAGILRHTLDSMDKEKINTVFGFQGKSDSGNGLGSRLICSSARMVDKDGYTVLDGLQDIDRTDSFYKAFLNLPIRQHVRINDKGTAEDKGKFDEEVVYIGTRFCFEVELIGESPEEVKFFQTELLPRMRHLSFRIGSGTRNGHGAVSIHSYQERTLDLRNERDLKAYLEKSSSLNNAFKWDDSERGETDSSANEAWTTYSIRLQPEDFFLFGSGVGDNEADITPVKEQVINYENPEIISDHYILIPASSVKGALSHRIAYYYNREVGYFADTKTENNQGGGTGKNNKAVQELFGYEGDIKNPEATSIRGNVLFSDLLIEPVSGQQEKLLNHVAIDRFTGGTIAGALFSEKVTWGNHQAFRLTIHVNNKALQNEKIKKALEYSLTDLCNGLLPLGGGSNRGNGRFIGEWTKKNQTTNP